MRSLLASLFCGFSFVASAQQAGAPAGQGATSQPSHGQAGSQQPSLSRAIPSKPACAAICTRAENELLSGSDKDFFNVCATALYCLGQIAPPMAVERPPIGDLPFRLHDFLTGPSVDGRV